MAITMGRQGALCECAAPAGRWNRVPRENAATGLVSDDLPWYCMHTPQC